MADAESGAEKPKKDRSPSFPFVSLRDAIKRLQAFDQTFGRHPAPGGKVGLAWGMKDKSSQAYQILAALKAFGLVRYEGSGVNLKASLTDEARTYLRAQQDSIKSGVLKGVALKPAQFAKFWTVWGADRPPDPVCLDQLLLQHAFTDSAAHNFLKVYDDTIAFAGLTHSDRITEESTEEDDPPFEFQVGELINWESGGQVQWKVPRRIVAIDDKGGQYFYKVEGAGEHAGQIGWIPVEQAIKQPSGSNQGGFAPPPPDLAILPPTGMRKAVFPVSDGDVTLVFPVSISTEGLEELGEYLEIFLKKEKTKK